MVAAREKFISNMKPWSRLCCLVLVISSTCRGQNATESTAVEDGEMEGANTTTSEPFPHLEPTYYKVNQSFPEPSSLSPASPSEAATSADEDPDVTVEEPGDATRGRTPAPPVTTVAMETTSTSKPPSPAAPAGGGSSSWAYVLLVLIILVIIVLCVILYFLRKASKSYSFELQRPSPSNDLIQPTGTFEPVYLDDLERPNLKDLESAEEPAPPPVTNGTSLQLEAKDGSEDADNPPVLANGAETSPAGDGGGPTPGDDPVDTATDPLSSIDLLLEPVGQQQNENNNNPSVRSSDPFVEINLDESPWSDQLLTSPEAPSSVLPFSPFSF